MPDFRNWVGIEGVAAGMRHGRGAERRKRLWDGRLSCEKGIGREAGIRAERSEPVSCAKPEDGPSSHERAEGESSGWVFGTIFDPGCSPPPDRLLTTFSQNSVTSHAEICSDVRVHFTEPNTAPCAKAGPVLPWGHSSRSYRIPGIEDPAAGRSRASWSFPVSGSMSIR